MKNQKATSNNGIVAHIPTPTINMHHTLMSYAPTNNTLRMQIFLNGRLSYTTFVSVSGHETSDSCIEENFRTIKVPFAPHYASQHNQNSYVAAIKNDSLAELLHNIATHNWPSEGTPRYITHKSFIRLSNSSLTKAEIDTLLVALEDNSEIKRKIKALFLSNNQLKILDLSSLENLTNVELQNSQQLRVLIISPNASNMLFLQLINTNLTMANKIAIKAINKAQHEEGFSIASTLVSTTVPESRDHLKNIELPDISIEILAQHFDYIMAQYDMASPSRCNELSTLIYNNVRMFERAFPQGTPEGDIFADFLCEYQAFNFGEFKAAPIKLRLV